VCGACFAGGVVFLLGLLAYGDAPASAVLGVAAVVVVAVFEWLVDSAS